MSAHLNGSALEHGPFPDIVYFRGMVLDFLPCTRADVPVLAQLGRQTFSEAFQHQNNAVDFQNYLNKAFSTEQVAQEMATAGSTFYLAYKRGVRCGYFKVNCNGAQTDLKSADSMELERIYVLASFQGQGIGTEILTHVMGLAREDKKRVLWLGVWERNPKAIALYQRMGFKKFGEHPYFIGNDKQTDWLMRKEIHKLAP